MCGVEVGVVGACLDWDESDLCRVCADSERNSLRWSFPSAAHLHVFILLALSSSATDNLRGIALESYIMDEWCAKCENRDVLLLTSFNLLSV